MPKTKGTEKKPTRKPFKEQLSEDLKAQLKWRELFKLIGSALAALISFAANRFGEPVFRWISNIFGRYSTQLALCLLIVCAGFGAHWFKKKDKRWYGIVEVFFGAGSAVTIIFSTGSQQLPIPQWATLVGCAYVIARGLNNISEAKEDALKGNTVSV